MAPDLWRERLGVPRIEALLQQVLAHGRLTEAAPALLVYDLDFLKARVQQLLHMFPPNTLHAIAIKANPLVAVLKKLVDWGLGLEAASMEEVVLAQAAGCAASHIVFDGPAKTRGELAEALRLGVRINADHFDELQRLRLLNPSRNIGLRINPETGAGSIAATSVSTVQGRFGVSYSQDVEEVLRWFEVSPWLDTLHMHVGSQGVSLESVVRAYSRLASLAARIQRPLTLDVGGGLPTTYTDGRPGPGLQSWYRTMETVPQLMQYPLVTEFGRALHANAAVAISRVERVRPGHQAVIHLGADFLLRTAYRPADWPVECLIFNAQGRLKEAEQGVWTILGPLCFAGDVVASEVRLPSIAEGDLLVVRDVGAYTLSLWSRHCSRVIPEVLGVSEAGLETLRQRERLDDVVAFWSKGPDGVL